MSPDRNRPRDLVTAVLLAMALLLAGPRESVAQMLPTTVTAVINYQRILDEAAAARSIREQIEVRRKAYQEEIGKEEQRLHEADKEFAKQRSLLTAEAFAEKRREFERQVADVQRLVQERRRELDSASAAALKKVQDALIEVVTSIAEERGFNLVLPSSQVLFFSRKIDLTEEVLAKLDERLPDVRVPKATQ